jgi:hypothetical protein
MRLFCVVVGIVLIVITFLPVPFGLSLQSGSELSARAAVADLFQSGVINCDSAALLAKHGTEFPDFVGAEIDDHDAQQLVGHLVSRRVQSAVGPLGRSVMLGTPIVGLLWIFVGLLTPRPREDPDAAPKAS